MNKCGKEWNLISEHELRYMYPYGILRVENGYQYINREGADVDNTLNSGIQGRSGYNVFALSNEQHSALEKLGLKLNNGYWLYDERSYPWANEKYFDNYFNLLFEVRLIAGHE